jgi:multidrug efflux pump subunit AcrB
MNDLPQNLAGRLAEMFISSKLTVLTIMSVVVFGAIAVVLTPREENPQINIPAAQITVQLPGASSLEVESLIVTPLEAIVSEITGVDHTQAVAMNSVGVVVVQFKAGENKEASLIRLYDRIFSNLDRIPSGAGTPLIRAIDADDIAAVTVTLSSTVYDDYALKRMADRIAARLPSLPSVSVVSVEGGRDREIRVDLDPDRLAAYGVPLSRVRDTLTGSNFGTPVGHSVRAGTVHMVTVKGFFQNADDVRTLIVGQNEGRPIYLGDVADVVDGPPIEPAQLSRFSFGAADPRFSELGGQDLAAVTLAVSKKAGANSVFMAEDVIARIERMQAEFLPRDVQLVVTRNDGETANAAVNLLIEHLGIAIATVLLILILFLGWREALIVAISVPLVLLVTVGVDFVAGITINRVSLFALILSLGLLVDDAIVVIENIHRHYAHGRKGHDSKRDITIRASAEVGGPANLATATVVVVFASLVLVSGMPGQYFFPVAINVPIAMVASLFFAYTVTPWAAYRWLDLGALGEAGAVEQRPRWLARAYHWFLLLAMQGRSARLALYAVTLAMLLLTVLQPAWQFIRPEGVVGPKPSFGVAMAFLPKDDANSFNVAVTMPESTPVETTDRLVREVNAVLVHHPLVTNTLSWIGRSGVADQMALMRGPADLVGQNIAEIRVNLIDKHLRTTSSIELVRDLRPQLVAIGAAYPGAKVQLVEVPPGPAMRATVLAEIYGDDLAILRSLSDRAEAIFNDAYDMVDVSTSQPEDVNEYRIIVDQEKALLSGVSTAQIGQVLRVLFEGEVVDRLHLDDEKNVVPIRVRVPNSQQLDPTRLETVFVENAAGQHLALSELVKVVPGTRDRPILHKDNERVTFVGGELAQTSQLYAIAALDQRFSGLEVGNGVSLETGNLTLASMPPDTIGKYQLLWNGEIRLMLDTYRDMSMVLGLALLLVFFLLVGYYKSFKTPMVAMASIPLGLIGVFPGHWLMGADFSATSMVGIIALAGVAIRSSLLIIDFIRENRAQGMDLQEAAYQAGVIRARPILLTTLAVVLGSSIMLTDPAFGGLAISLIFGTVVSSALSIIIVPLLYYGVEKRSTDRAEP